MVELRRIARVQQAFDFADDQFFAIIAFFVGELVVVCQICFKRWDELTANPAHRLKIVLLVEKFLIAHLEPLFFRSAPMMRRWIRNVSLKRNS